MRLREKTHRNQQAGKQLDQPEFCANQRQDRLQRNGAGADHEVDRAHEKETAEHADQEQRKILRARTGPCTGNTSATTIAVGTREQPQAERRFAHGPRNPHPLHRHGLDQVHGDLAFDHFVRHFLVDRVPVKRADYPADAHVRQHLRQVVSGDVWPELYTALHMK